MTGRHVDVIIIGFGTGGKKLALFLAKKGLSVVVIEKSSQMYGGTCINVGCIPTKSLVHSAELAFLRQTNTFRHQEDIYQEALRTKERLVISLRDKNYSNLSQHPGIEIQTGQATFLSPNEVRVRFPDGTTTDLTAERIFINSGAEPSIPSIPGVESSRRTYTSTTIMELTQLPRHLIIIGSGYVGMEFASIYSQFGSKVTVLNRGSSLMPREERDMAEEVKKVLEKRGVTFISSVEIESIQDDLNHSQVTIRSLGETQTLESDAILISTGRKPNTSDLHLDRAGVEVDKKGYIQVDDTLRTRNPKIWALGDVNGGPQFTYISLDDYRIVKDQLYGSQTRTRKDRFLIPYTVFLSPPFARVGMTEDEAIQKGYEIKVSKLPVFASSRARILQQTEGLFKAVVDVKSGAILGCTLFGIEASELINTVTIAMELGQTYTYLRDRIYTHPSMSEVLNELFAQFENL